MSTINQKSLALRPADCHYKKPHTTKISKNILQMKIWPSLLISQPIGKAKLTRHQKLRNLALD